MSWTSSFRSVAVAALLAAAGEAVAQDIGKTRVGCYDANGNPIPDCYCDGTCGGSSTGGSTYVMTEEERERQRRFWGDGSSYWVNPETLPSMMELWRGKRTASSEVRRQRSWIRGDAFATMQGHDAIAAGNWALAEANYRLAVHAGSADAPTWKGLGYALLKGGKPRDATEVLEIAHASFPRDRGARSLLVAALDANAHALFLAGDLAAARAAWKRVLELEAGDPAAKANLPRAEEYQARLSEAAAQPRPAGTAWSRKPLRLALGGAFEQLVDAEREGTGALTAGSDEDAKERAALVFETALKDAVIVSLPDAVAGAPAPGPDAAAAPPAIVAVREQLRTTLEEVDRTIAAKNAETASPERDAVLAALERKRRSLEEQRESMVRIELAVTPQRRVARAITVPTPFERPQVPAALVLAAGAIADHALKKEYGAFATDPRAQERVNRALSCLAPKLGLNREEIYPKLLSKQKRKRPFRYASATFSGRIYVEVAFLDSNPSDDELAFVLAHELGHVAAYHGEKLLASADLSPSAANTQELETNNPEVRALAEQALKAGAKRPQELEADGLAVVAMKACGYQMSGVEEFFRRIALGEKAEAPHDDKVHDHPSAAERMEHLRPRMQP